MSRPAEKVHPEFDEAAVRRDLDAATEDGKRLAVIDKAYGDNLPYQRDRIINEVRFYMAEAAQAALEVGRRLIVLKEHEPHGDFLEALEQVDLHPKTAQRMMKAAAKFSGPKTTTLSHLGKSKLFELMTEDDEDLEALAEGGTLAGHTLDEIDRMSARELRAALRKARDKSVQDAETNERLLADKNAKIDDLDRKLHEARDHTRPWPRRAFELSMETTNRAAEALEACDRLDILRDAILTEDFEDGEREAAVESMAVVYYDAVSKLLERAQDLAVHCEEVFSGYKESARPLLNVEAFQGQEEGA